MTRRTKRLFKILGVLYLVAVVLFLVTISKGRHEWTRPMLRDTELHLPQRSAFTGDKGEKNFQAAKERIVRARYLVRGEQAGLGADTLIGREELDRLIAAGRGKILVRDTRVIREFAARKLRSGEEFLDRSNMVIAQVEDELDEERLVRMALAYDDEKGDDRHAEIWVRGRGSLIGFDLTLVFAALNFLVLVALLYALLWEPVTRLLDDRARSVREDVDTARRSREEAQSLRETRETELGKIREDADRLRDEGRHRGEAERARLIQEGREEASRLAERRERALDAEAEQARKHLAGEIGKMSVELASRILGREVSAEDHKGLAEEFVRKLESEAGSKEAQG
ncbi:MAG: F0F1 ATP synthase subunit B [Planctomycetota bacterium]|jgi:F-type H+-transporting ATPase subunit b